MNSIESLILSGSVPGEVHVDDTCGEEGEEGRRAGQRREDASNEGKKDSRLARVKFNPTPPHLQIEKGRKHESQIYSKKETGKG